MYRFVITKSVFDLRMCDTQDICSYGSLTCNMRHSKSILKICYVVNNHNSLLLGNAGYPLESYLMTPYQSACEERVENLTILNMLMGEAYRWLLDGQKLHYTESDATAIINICCALHNICIGYDGHEITHFC